MSNKYNYLPIPPRVWSRVQNPCTYTDASGNSDINYNQVYIPLTNQTVSQAQANYEDKLIYKGNILQYKGNSSQLTKSQKYTQLAKGFGPNRKKVFATQSQTYTNPNTTGLQRKNSITIPFPNGVVGEPNNISGPYQYNVTNPNGCSGTSIQDGGTLVCGTFANPCTGQLIRHGATSATICNPASASDVPGSSTLCWNNKVQTWFPRQRYFMNNSTDKWPVNYKGLDGYSGLASATRPGVPVLTLDSTTCNSATLSWDVSNNCISIFPITSYNIYQNGILVQNVPYTTTSITVEIFGNSIFYVTSISGVIESFPSNVVDANFLLPISITGDASSNYTYTGSYYIITFQNSNGYTQTTSNYTITFNQNINNLNYVIVGGGGGGGSDNSITYKDGGGGGAGGCITSGSINVICGKTYNISVGYGGQSQSSNNQNGGTGGSSSFSSYNANGGQGGFSYINGGTGGVGTNGGKTGGTGGIYSSTSATDGVNSSVYYKIPPNQPDSINNMFYFSGGGGGGSYYQQASSSNGGLGGGGAGGFSTGYNYGQPYYGPNGIYYPAGSTSFNGLISTGGGGAGQNGNNTPGGNVGVGGSGIVVLYFQYP